METQRTLRRSVNEKVIAGVCGGLAKYLRLDPVIVRLIFVLLIMFGGGGLIAYIILWIVVPEEPYTGTDYFKAYETKQPGEAAAETAEAPGSEEPKAETQAPAFDPASYMKPDRSKGQLVMGIILIGVGGLFLFAALLPHFHVGDFWPVLIILLGLVILIPAFKNSGY